MCLSKVYLQTNTGLELVMEDTAKIQVDGNMIILKTIFGESTKIEAHVQQVDLMTHKVILRKA